MESRAMTRRDIEDFTVGAKILGCGGGGAVGWVDAWTRKLEELGKKVSLVSPEDVPEEALVVTVSGVGGGVGEDVKRRIMRRFGRPGESWEMLNYRARSSTDPYPVAERTMSNYLGEEVHAYVPFETGAAVGMMAGFHAALNDKPCVDGDFVGRAVPELGLSTLGIEGVSPTPVVLANAWREAVILCGSVDVERAEDMARQIAAASGGMAIMLACPLRGYSLRKLLVPSTISRSIELGEAVRTATQEREDPVKAVIRTVQAHLLFKGRVVERTYEGRGGWNTGETRFEGTDEYRGRAFRIWYRNENMISWLDERPHVMCPDLIAVLDTKTGIALGNAPYYGEPYYREGREIAVIGLRSHGLLRTERALELFSPRRFGFDLEFVPIDDLYK